MSQNRCLYVLVLIFMCLTSALLQAERLKVFICAGQSNMVGKRSVVAKLPVDLQTKQKNFIIGKEMKWSSLIPADGRPQGFGPEVSFACEMSKALGQPVGIIKFNGKRMPASSTKG